MPSRQFLYKDLLLVKEFCLKVDMLYAEHFRIINNKITVNAKIISGIIHETVLTALRVIFIQHLL